MAFPLHIETSPKVGIGCNLERVGKEIIISRLSENGSARKAGLLVGSSLFSVDGLSVIGKELQEIRELIMGSEGSFVNLAVLDPASKNGNVQIVHFRIMRMPKNNLSASGNESKMRTVENRTSLSTTSGSSFVSGQPLDGRIGEALVRDQRLQNPYKLGQEAGQRIDHSAQPSHMQSPRRTPPPQAKNR